MELIHIKNRKFSATAFFYMFCCFLVILKIVLVSGEEILARDQPFDDFWQIQAAVRGYWLGGAYTHMTYIHLPVYSLWVALVYFTGIPLRIAIELLFLVSGFLFVLSLSKAGINRFICILSYGLIIFHPVSFHLFNYSLAETLYAPLFILALSTVIMMWLTRGQRACLVYAILFGGISSLLWNLRKENVLILGLILFFAIVAVILLRGEGQPWRTVARQTAVMIIVPIAIISGVSLSLQTANYLKFRMLVSTEMSAPGYTAAYKALLRIKPQQPMRFIPVTKEVRQAAYKVSPAFRELETFFEGDLGYAAASETRKWMGIQGEISAGWFYWAFRDAAAFAGHHTSAVDANAYYQRIADEINAAIDSGRLPGRPVLMTFLDPEINNYLPYLPNSLAKMWRLFITSTHQYREEEAADINPEVRKLFDSVCNRRTALTGNNLSRLQGWVFQENNPVKRVQMMSANGRVLGSCEIFTPRPDVVSSYNSHGVKNVPATAGFHMTIANAVQQLDDAKLVFTSKSNKQFVVPYKEIAPGKAYQVVSSDPNQKIYYAIDSLSLSNLLKLRNTAQNLVWSAYGNLVKYLSYIAIVAGLIIVVSYRSLDFTEGIYTVLTLMIFAVFTRVALFTLLDASSWPGNQARYLFPVMPIYSCFLLLVIYKAFCVVSAKCKPSN